MLVLAALVTVPGVAADPCVPTCSPSDLTGDYDVDNGVVSLSWQPPTGPAPDSYNVYRDGALIGQASTPSHVDVLGVATSAVYWVTAQTGTTESAPAGPFMVTSSKCQPGHVVTLGPLLEPALDDCMPLHVPKTEIKPLGPLPDPCIPGAGVSGDYPFLVVDDTCFGGTDSPEPSPEPSDNSTGGP